MVEHRAVRFYLHERATFSQRYERILLIGDDRVDVSGLADEVAVRVHGVIYLIPNTPLAAYLRSWVDEVEQDVRIETELFKVVLANVVAKLLLVRYVGEPEEIERYVAREIDDTNRLLETEKLEAAIDVPELLKVLSATNWSIFDPSAWVRKDSD